MDSVSLTEKIYELYKNRNKYVTNMNASSQVDATNKIISLIEENAKSK